MTTREPLGPLNNNQGAPGPQTKNQEALNRQLGDFGAPN